MTTPLSTTLDIKTMLELPTNKIFAYCYLLLEKVYPREAMVSDWDNYMVFKGDNPITLVAHVDTCNRTTVKIKQKNNIIYNPGAILGADDRAGVYGLIKAAKKCLRKGIPLPTLVFTNYEESGGKGVKNLISSSALDTKSTRLFVELDRKGMNEYVFYSWTLPKPVKKYVEGFGFIKSEGSYSDISDLTYEYEIPAVNLSIGYYHQHTNQEKLHVDEMEFTINRVVKMLQNPIPQLYKCEDRCSEDMYWIDKWEGKSSAKNYLTVVGGRNRGTFSGYSRDKYYNYEKDMYEYYDHADSLSRLHSKNTNYYRGLDTYSMKGIEYYKADIRRQLIQDSAIFCLFEDLLPSDRDALEDLELTFNTLAVDFPEDLGEVFEMAWSEIMERYCIGIPDKTRDIEELDSDLFV